MTKQNTRRTSLLIGAAVAVMTFVLLSAFAGGLIEFSRDAGFFLWLRDLLAYSFTNKILQKLFASFTLGFAAYFINQMIVYGKQVSAKKRARATRVRFTPRDNDSFGQTA